jgi:hypothetical protein
MHLLRWHPGVLQLRVQTTSSMWQQWKALAGHSASQLLLLLLLLVLLPMLLLMQNA